LIDKETQNKIDEILSHVKSLDGQMAWLVKSQVQGIKTELVDYLVKKRRRVAKVYLAVDGERTVKAISDYLIIEQPNVSKEIQWLEDNGLIRVQKWGTYKKEKIDSILGLSAELRKDAELRNIK
jgi:hypothetical protein